MGKKTRWVEKNGSDGGAWHRQKKKRTKRLKYYWQRRKAWKERWVEKHGSGGGAWHWRVGVRDEQRTTVHQLFPPAFPFFSCFPLFIRWWFGPNSLSQLLNFFWDCWLSQQHDGRVWLLICRSCESGTQSYSCKGTAPQILLLGASYFPFWIWVICYCWGNSSMVEGRFSKWF